MAGRGKKLDVEAETLRLMAAQGAALVAAEGLVDPDRRHELQTQLWQLFPFVKALGALGAAHPDELALLWRHELEEPMPFGMPPIGLEDDETKF